MGPPPSHEISKGCCRLHTSRNGNVFPDRKIDDEVGQAAGAAEFVVDVRVQLPRQSALCTASALDGPCSFSRTSRPASQID